MQKRNLNLPEGNNLITAFKGRKLDKHLPVQLYRNLRYKTPVYSVRQAGKVVAHTGKIALTGCKLVVNESGRQRVLRTGQKNVHAYIEGIVLNGWTDKMTGERVKYNPFKNKYFVCNGKPLKNSLLIFLNQNGVFALTL